MKRILKKIISPFIFLVVIISLVISFYLGAYTYYYKMFPFNPSKNVKQIKKTIKTNYNILTLKSYNSPKYSKYGAIDYYDNKLIYVQGNGDFYFFNRKENQFDFEKIISEKIPNNRKAFIQRYKEKYGNTRMSNFFGVIDINKRIRDIIESPQGEIILLTDQRGGADGYNDIPEIIFISKNEDAKLLQITN